MADLIETNKTYLPFERREIMAMKEKLGEMYDLNGKPFKKTYGFLWKKELIKSQIPKNYWNFELAKLKIDKKIISKLQDFTKKHSSAKSNGLGFIFYGDNGRGKTSSAICLSLEFMLLGYSVAYITVQTLLDFQTDFDNPENRQIILNRLKSADVIILDEWDRNKFHVNKETMYGMKFLENFMRQNLTANKILLLCTNLSEKDITQSFNRSIYSLIQRQLKFVEFTGSDISKERRKEWDSILNRKDKELNQKQFMQRGEIFYNNREKRRK